MPLRARAQVALVADAFPALPATVVTTTRSDATLLLGPEVRGAVEGRRFRGEAEIAMVTGRRGRVRDDTVVLRFSSCAPGLRRVHPRAPAVLPATVVPVGSRLAPAPAPAPTLDLNAGGAVVRRTSEGLLGVRLDRMRPADRDLVIRWIQGRAGGGRQAGSR